MSTFTVGPLTTSTISATAVTGSGQLNITNATTSSSTVSGSIITAGGVGVVKDVYIGGLTNVAGSLLVGTTITGSSTILGNGNVGVANGGSGDLKILRGNAISTSQTYTTNTVLQTADNQTGGFSGWATYLWTPGNGGDGSQSTFVLGANATGLYIPASTASTNSTNGAITCPGGMGLGGNLNVGGGITVAGAFVPASLSSAGNVGTTGGDLKMVRGNAISVTGYTTNTVLQSANGQSGGLGGWATYLYTPGNGGGDGSQSTFVLGVNSSGLLVPASTASTTTSTGAIVTPGGIGCAGYIHAAGVAAAGGFSSDLTNYFGYTVGTWTPTVTVYSYGSIYNNGTNYSITSATYTKIGNLVTLQADFTYDLPSGNPAVSLIAITGNPYIIKNGQAVAVGSYYNNMAGVTNPLYMQLSKAGSIITGGTGTQFTSTGYEIVIFAGAMVYQTPQLLGATGQRFTFTLQYLTN